MAMKINPNIFKGSNEVTVGHSSDWMKPGDYLFRLDSVSLKYDRYESLMFVAELTVVHIYSLDEGPDGDKIRGHKIGDSVSIVSKQASNDYFLKDIKKILHHATGYPAEEIGQPEYLFCCGFDEEGVETGDKPIDGAFIVLHYNNTQKEKQDKPGEFFTSVNLYGKEDPADLLTILPDEIQDRFFTADGNNQLVVQVEEAAAE